MKAPTTTILRIYNRIEGLCLLAEIDARLVRCVFIFEFTAQSIAYTKLLSLYAYMLHAGNLRVSKYADILAVW